MAPDLVALHQRWPGRYPFLLQSTSGDGWDILAAFPRAVDSWPDAVVTRPLGGGGVDPGQDDGPPFRGGWFVFLSYELLYRFEPSVGPPPADTCPASLFLRCPAAIQHHRGRGETVLFAEPGHRELAQAMAEDLRSLDEAPPPAGVAAPARACELVEEDPRHYLEGVERVRAYIRAGDVFQVNLSRAWSGRLERPDPEQSDPVALYRRLSLTSPAPFAGSVRLPDRWLLSSSPERLVRVRGGQVETRPIAGTCRRGTDTAEDERLRTGLLRDAKEQAEHIMLVDLERNDLGRVCQPGSITVPELLSVCSYSHVHHLESRVRGRLRPDTTLAALLRGVFPGGTITGCPKVRTMQIIRALESGPRQEYTGSMGYVNLDGSLDLNILIRTMSIQGDRFRFRTGAGIVADSSPERELTETREKARGLLAALGVAAP